MSKHTPGPWVAMKDGKYVTENPWSVDHEDGHDNTMAPIGGPDGQVVALVVMDDENSENRWDDTELDANARLIAAAPELLDALKLTSDCLSKCLTGGEVSAALAGRALVQAGEAVTKATIA